MPQLSSLRETIMAQIGSFLFKEGFNNETQFLREGIFEIINLISDYQEEGKTLFPEVLITNNLELLRSIPDYKVSIGKSASSVDAFKKIIKSCAPLCSSEWVIYIEVKDGILTYGLTCAELTETTPSLFKQTVGEMRLEIPKCNVAYIRNIGTKLVQMMGLKDSMLVSLSLSDVNEVSANELSKLARNICHDLTQRQELATNFIEKILSDGFKEGHGNLIGVVKNNSDAIKNLIENFPEGNYLPEPIDLVALLNALEADKTASNSVALRQHAHIIKAMCNNDGISIFTSDGKLIAYHVINNKDFIPGEVKRTITGGARTQAFFNMKHSKCFISGLMKSQDGPIKIF